MKKINIIIVLAILFSSCDVKKSENENPVIDLSDHVQLNLKKISEFKIENTQSLTLGRVRDFIVLNKEENRIAWVNEDDNEVFLTEINGTYICSFGSVGSGPEEFQEVSTVGFGSNNNIIVYDAKLDFFKKFDENCHIMSSYPGIHESGIWFSEPRQIFSYDDNFFFGIIEQDKASESNFWKSKTIAVFNNRLEIKNIFGSFDPLLIEGNYLYSYPTITVDDNTGLIYTTHRTLPQIQVFDPESELRIGRFGVYSSSFLVASEKAKSSDPMHLRRQKNLEQSFIYESFVSDKYIFLQHAQFTEDLFTYGDRSLRKAYLNIFEKEEPYAFFGEISLEFVPLSITSKGEIFLLEDNNPENFTVGVYELDKISNL